MNCYSSWLLLNYFQKFVNYVHGRWSSIWEDQVMTFLGNKQLPDSFRLTLLEGGQVGSGDAIFVPANAKHVAAALLLIDMAFSKDFQTWKLEHKASRSPRTDISDNLISAETRAHVLPDSVYPRLSVTACSASFTFRCRRFASVRA